jgi:uncharacterized membrane-anchored protein YitT (DUF2179 family)
MKKYLSLSLLLLLASLNFNLFLKTLNLVTGGTQGLAIIIKYFINLKPSVIIFIINIISLIISFILLKKDTTKSAIISTFLYPILVKLTSVIPEITFIKENILISSILAGLICGFTNGYIYNLNFSSGGLTILNIIINKYFNIKLSTSNFIINFLIIIAGTSIFGIKKALYSIIVILISSFIIKIIIQKKLTKK